jgi:hypothetical protein
VFSVEQDVEEKLVAICEIRKKVKKTELKNIVAGIHRDISENHGFRNKIRLSYRLRRDSRNNFSFRDL